MLSVSGPKYLLPDLTVAIDQLAATFYPCSELGVILSYRAEIHIHNSFITIHMTLTQDG